MTITRFLLIDSIFLLLAIALYVLLMNKNNKFLSFGTFDISNTSVENLKSIPDLKKLLELESIARNSGSGIGIDSLIGVWRFLMVWKQGTDKNDTFSSFLLRLFSASLELRKDKTNSDKDKIHITNSIQFSNLSILFCGSAELTGSQPLLYFYFQTIELKLGENILFRRFLAQPEDNNRPFFAFIAIGNEGKWLSARGRGGGLAYWVKD